MIVGIPKEIKNHEYRISLTPDGVSEIMSLTNGTKVMVQRDAAKTIGYSNEQYMEAGATIVDDPKQIYSEADLIVKVKEPSDEECSQLRKKQILFTYLHLAAFPEKIELLKESGSSAIAYETITDKFGTLPLLTPMSEIAGRVSVQAGAVALQCNNGGRGTLLGGVPGVTPGKVVILGGGVVGYNAARMAVGMGANVTIADISITQLKRLDDIFTGRVTTLYASRTNVEQAIANADLVIGAVLIPGAKAPKVITRKMLSLMSSGTVLADVSIDQGGCFETSKPTSHDDPIYIVDDIVHYCVSNIPGSVARTSTQALCNATLPYVKALVNDGFDKCMGENEHFAKGLNIHGGKIVNDSILQ